MTAVREAALIDLRRIETAQREGAWREAVGNLFPGLLVVGQSAPPTAGWVRCQTVGTGKLWSLLSPALRVSYSPQSVPESTRDLFSVMLQLRGTTSAIQHGRCCMLRSRELCFIDSTAPFELQVRDGLSEMTFLQIPRGLVMARHPDLQTPTAVSFGPDAPGAALLESTLRALADCASDLDGPQGIAALEAVVLLLGVPRPGQTRRPQDPGWRARAAVSFIDAELADSLLTAERVAAAQGVSRRRLDRILMSELGTSVTGQIWLRRLLRAADDLRDPRHAGRTVTQIAFQSGFEHVAHFARAFKRHFFATPSEWRNDAAKVDTQRH